jgi:hypothetical protein
VSQERLDRRLDERLDRRLDERLDGLVIIAGFSGGVADQQLVHLGEMQIP